MLVPRETPLLAIHLENMLRLSRGRRRHPAAARLLPTSAERAGIVDFVVARVLDQIGVPHALMQRWGEEG